MKRRHLPRMTRNNLMAALKRSDEKTGLGLPRPEDLDALIQYAEGVERCPSERGVDHVLKLCDKWLQGFGIRGCSHDEQGTVEMDVNTGGTYTETVLWCGLRNTFHVTTFGDWHEVRRRSPLRAFWS